MSEDAIERHAALFVGVESLIEKIAQEAAVLRDAFAVNATGWRDGLRIVFGIGSKIADCGEAEPGYDWILRDVNIFVDFAWLKAAPQMDVAVAGDELAVDGLCELPSGARDPRALCLA